MDPFFFFFQVGLGIFCIDDTDGWTMGISISLQWEVLKKCLVSEQKDFFLII